MRIALITMCVLLAVIAWLICGGRKLLRRQNDFALADKQLALYRVLYARARDGPEAHRAWEQLKLSQAIYRKVAAEYDQCVAKPIHRPVAWILGYRSVLPEKMD